MLLLHGRIRRPIARLRPFRALLLVRPLSLLHALPLLEASEHGELGQFLCPLPPQPRTHGAVGGFRHLPAIATRSPLTLDIPRRVVSKCHGVLHAHARGEPSTQRPPRPLCPAQQPVRLLAILPQRALLSKPIQQPTRLPPSKRQLHPQRHQRRRNGLPPPLDLEGERLVHDVPEQLGAIGRCDLDELIEQPVKVEQPHPATAVGLELRVCGAQPCHRAALVGSKLPRHGRIARSRAGRSPHHLSSQARDQCDQISNLALAGLDLPLGSLKRDGCSRGPRLQLLNLEAEHAHSLESGPCRGYVQLCHDDDSTGALEDRVAKELSALPPSLAVSYLLCHGVKKGGGGFARLRCAEASAG